MSDDPTKGSETARLTPLDPDEISIDISIPRTLGDGSFSRDKPKTVAQLIDELRKYPPETRVMTDGYEGGLQDCRSPELLRVKLNVNDDWYDGPHENVTEDPESNDANVIAAIRL